MTGETELRIVDIRKSTNNAQANAIGAHMGWQASSDRIEGTWYGQIAW
jgi:hypothetical protein